MVCEFGAIDRFGVAVLFGLEQRRSEPVARGERQRLRLVVHQTLLEIRSRLEGRESAGQIATHALDFAIENPRNHAEQILCGSESKRGLRGVSSLPNPFEV